MIIKKKSLEKILKQRQRSQSKGNRKALALEEADYQLDLDQIRAEIKELEIKKQNLLKDSEEEARKILEQASSEGTEIIENAEEEAEKILKSSKSFLEKIERDFQESISKLLNTRKDFLKDSEQTVLDLAIELTRKITRYQVKKEPKVFKNLMSEALKEINLDPEQKSKLHFTVNPEDQSVAKSYIEEFEQKYENQIQIFIDVDPEVEEGSCILESPFGTIDLNFSSQIDLFKLKIAQS